MRVSASSLSSLCTSLYHSAGKCLDQLGVRIYAQAVITVPDRVVVGIVPPCLRMFSYVHHRYYMCVFFVQPLVVLVERQTLV